MLVQAIQYAAGLADILTFSLSLDQYDPAIALAIAEARSSGRGGRGLVIIAAAGNDDASDIGFPASVDGVLAVGATDYCGNRKTPTFTTCGGDIGSWGSSYGAQLDIMAPGISIFPTDITGLSGFTTSSYNQYFGGTSAAAPIVAGVAGLMLSAAPQLTELQVREFIQNSAVDLYTPGRDDLSGYGLVNAPSAIVWAVSQYPNYSPILNDDIANSIWLPETLPFTNQQNALQTTRVANDPPINCEVNGQIVNINYVNSVWYTFVPGTSQNLRFLVNTLFYEDFDPVMAIYEDRSMMGTGQGLYQVACNDDYLEEDTAASIAFVPRKGAFYRILIARKSPSNYPNVPGIDIFYFGVYPQKPDTIGVHRFSNSYFYLRNSNSAGLPNLSIWFGLDTDIPITGDWNGDGVDGVGLVRGEAQTAYLKNVNTTQSPIDYYVPMSQIGGRVLSGDWNCDGKDTLASFQNGVFAIQSNSLFQPPDTFIHFGLGTDFPVVGDWNGDCFHGVGVFRNGVFYLSNQYTSGSAAINSTVVFGDAFDIPVIGDWDGDGTDDVGVFRHNEGIFYLKFPAADGLPDLSFLYGADGDSPLAGRWELAYALDAYDLGVSRAENNPTKSNETAPVFVPRK